MFSKARSLPTLLLKRRIRRLLRLPPAPASGPNPECEAFCQEVRQRKLTFLSLRSLYSLSSLVRELETKKIPGDIIEAGCALGGSSLVIAFNKSKQRNLRLYDTFEMIPPPTEKDGPDVHARYREISSGAAKGIGDDPYYGYLDDIPQRLRNSFGEFDMEMEEHHVSMHKGLVEDTLVVNGPVALAHVDVDWYSPVHTCLERIVPNISPGGFVVLDDYDAWSGCRTATDEYFSKPDNRFEFSNAHGHLVVKVL